MKDRMLNVRPLAIVVFFLGSFVDDDHSDKFVLFVKYTGLEIRNGLDYDLSFMLCKRITTKLLLQNCELYTLSHNEHKFFYNHPY